jgi:hypothetical protein
MSIIDPIVSILLVVYSLKMKIKTEFVIKTDSVMIRIYLKM